MTTRTKKKQPPAPIRLSGKRRYGLRAGFDGAASNKYVNNHFNDASSNGIDYVIDADRAVLTKRCRYEYRNNAYARAMVMTWTNEIVGSGPTLQMTTGNDLLDATIEDRFAEWAQYCDASERQTLTGLLQTGLRQMPQFGEEFTTFTNAREGSRSAKRTDLRLRLLEINPSRVTNPGLYMPAIDRVDGIKVDPRTGAPVLYYVCDSSKNNTIPGLEDYREVPAEDMLHLFLHDEAGQYRGFPMMATVLSLMGDLRRYTKAVVSAAEQAANISGVVRTQMADATDVAEAMDEIEIARNALLTLPAGYDISQLKAEQPTGTYKDFKHELIGEIGRAFFLPYLLAAGNAQGYNYSSGRLDLQDWWKAKSVVQNYVAERKLDEILYRFLQEAILVNNDKPGFLKGYTTKMRQIPIWQLKHVWNWPGNEHVDPSKEATAEQTKLTNNTMTLAESYGRRGKDWERNLEQRAREIRKIKDLEETYGIDMTPNETNQPAMAEPDDADEDGDQTDQ